MSRPADASRQVAGCAAHWRRNAAETAPASPSGRIGGDHRGPSAFLGRRRGRRGRRAGRQKSAVAATAPSSAARRGTGARRARARRRSPAGSSPAPTARPPRPPAPAAGNTTPAGKRRRHLPPRQILGVSGPSRIGHVRLAGRGLDESPGTAPKRRCLPLASSFVLKIEIPCRKSSPSRKLFPAQPPACAPTPLSQLFGATSYPGANHGPQSASY